MKQVPEKGRDTTGLGRAIDPTRNNQDWPPGCVSYPFSAVRKGVSPDARRLYTWVAGSESGDGGRSGVVAGWSCRGCGTGRSRDSAVRTSVSERRSSDGTLGRSERSERGQGNVKSSEASDSGSSGRVRCASRSCDRPAVVVADRPDGDRALVCWPHLALVESLGGSLVGVVRGE